ncbi:ankyrin repeat domain-containing protein SOWAHC [Engraulis encrasicolus]|uniref:ankyrin repeat domain-containing protein SOWAHC n=1 Tax=Engraulis encrasicolus TaxID=184585 RepID=UPI002FD3576C
MRVNENTSLHRLGCLTMASECTQEAVLRFLIEKGGRVKNRELIDHFKVTVSGDPSSKATFKETLKRFVDNIAFVKQENGEKYVCLKKKYREAVTQTVERDDGECNGNGLPADGIILSKRNGSCCASGATCDQENESAPEVADGIGEETAPSSEVQSALNLDPSANENESEHVVFRGPTISGVNRRRTSRGSQRSLLALSEDMTNESVFDTGDSNTPKGSRKNFIELMMSSSPQVRRTLVHRNSQTNMSVTNRESVRSEGDTASLLSGEGDCASVTLDPLEHEWMMCASDGQWESLQRLLVCEANLITKRDFVTGFTCLHWAAKQGKPELLANLVTFAKEHDIPVNINARSSAGYTPLHLAAMHNHVEVMKLLVGAYDADVEMRDYSGKKASQYLSSSVAGDLKDIVGGTSDSDVENAESGAGWWRLAKGLPSNLNPLRLLNQAADEAQCDSGGAVAVRPRSLYRKTSIGRIKLNRNRFKTQIVHSTSFRETDEGEGSLLSPVKSRPMSNLFG